MPIAPFLPDAAPSAWPGLSRTTWPDDSAYLVAIRPADPADLSLVPGPASLGQVMAVRNRGHGGAAYDFVQPVASACPSLGSLSDGTPALVFTEAGEGLECDALAPVMNSPGAAWLLDLVFEADSITKKQVLLSWTTRGSAHGFQTLGLNGIGDIRSTRRDAEGRLTFATDSTARVVPGQTSVLSLVFAEGGIDGYLNANMAFAGAGYVSSTGPLGCDRFSVGSRKERSASPGFKGRLAFLGLRAWD